MWSIHETPEGTTLSHGHHVPDDLLPSLRDEPLGARRHGNMGNTRGDWARMRAARYMVDKHRANLKDAEDRLAIVVYEMYWENVSLRYVAKQLGASRETVRKLAEKGARLLSVGDPRAWDDDEDDAPE